MSKWLLRFDNGPCVGQTAVFDPEEYEMPDEAPAEVIAWESMQYGRWVHMPNIERLREGIRFDEERGMQPRGDRIPILLYRREGTALVDTNGEVKEGLSPGGVYVLKDQDEWNRYHEYRDNNELTTR